MTKATDTPSDAVVRHVAAILEEWDMKEPPNEFTGHDYTEIAMDVVSRAALTTPASAPEPSDDALTQARTIWEQAQDAYDARLQAGDGQSPENAAASVIAAALRQHAPTTTSDDGLEELARALYEVSSPDGARWECVEPHYQETVWRARAKRLVKLTEPAAENG